MAGEAEDTPGWTRRQWLGGAAALTALIGVPLGYAALDGLPDGAAPTAAQRRMLDSVAQLVLPRTDTPGAAEVGTGPFVVLALAHGLENARKVLPLNSDAALLRWRQRDGSLDHLGWLGAELNRRGGGDFLTLSPSAQHDVLAALDAAAYAPDVQDHPWRTLKTLILTGYYTSEVGGSQELRFELVPGRYDPDIPLAPGDQAWSSDWTAVDFG